MNKHSKQLEEKYTKIWFAIAIISAAMLFFAVKDLVYDYYQIMRTVVFASSLFGVWYFYLRNNLEWVWLLLIVGLVFNPIQALTLEQSTWRALNVLGGSVFIASLLTIKGARAWLYANRVLVIIIVALLLLIII